VYRAYGRGKGIYRIDTSKSTLTLEKPDDVDEPCGELVEVDGRIVYAPYKPGGFFYISLFSGRWE